MTIPNQRPAAGGSDPAGQDWAGEPGGSAGPAGQDWAGDPGGSAGPAGQGRVGKPAGRAGSAGNTDPYQRWRTAFLTVTLLAVAVTLVSTVLLAARLLS